MINLDTHYQKMEQDFLTLLHKIKQFDYDTQVGIYSKIQTPKTTPYLIKLHSILNESTIIRYNSHIISFIENQYEEYAPLLGFVNKIKNDVVKCNVLPEKIDYLNDQLLNIQNQIPIDSINTVNNHRIRLKGYQDKFKLKEIDLNLDYDLIQWYNYLLGKLLREKEIFLIKSIREPLHIEISLDNSNVIFRDDKGRDWFYTCLVKMNAVDDKFNVNKGFQSKTKAIFDTKGCKEKVFVYDLSQKDFYTFLNKRFNLNIRTDKVSDGSIHLLEVEKQLLNLN